MTKIYKYLYDVLTKDFDSSFPQEREEKMKIENVGLLDLESLQQYSIADREVGFEQALRSCTTISHSGLVSVKSNSRKKEKAVLPLRCKILNIERRDKAAMYKNEEIQNLILALGLGVKGEDWNSIVADDLQHCTLCRDKKEQWGSYFGLVIHLRAIAIAIAISKFSLSTDFEAPPPPPSSTKQGLMLGHKSWRVREEFARTVTLAIGLFASTELPLQRELK
ncbi:unnamed protein product [Camellia sinensis]